MEKPEWLADGYRSERCARCGSRIGYGFFTANDSMVTVDGQPVKIVQFLHRDRGTNGFPSWCQLKEEATR